MTKILLVEKRYDGVEENPSITAKWIEIPDGEEELFLKEQLFCTHQIKALQQEESNYNFKQRLSKLSPERIMTIVSYVGLAIAAPIVYFIYHLAPGN